MIVALGVTGAQAATVIVGQNVTGGSPGTVSPAIAGVHGIVVGSTAYDMDFYFDTPRDIWGFDSDGSFVTTPFSFGKQGLTLQILAAANDAIDAQSLNSFTNRDKDDVLPDGGSGSQLTSYRAPVSISESANFPGIFFTNDVRSFRSGGSFTEAVSGTSNPGNTYVYAEITEVGTVPVPAPAVLLLAGIGALLLSRRNPA